MQLVKVGDVWQQGTEQPGLRKVFQSRSDKSRGWELVHILDKKKSEVKKDDCDLVTQLGFL